ncbi:MAG: Beta-propeller repeat protein [Chitinophagaceae bacterium]|nr:Beta-propeller repeat protein [Chitinophagaceae bacterium]
MIIRTTRVILLLFLVQYSFGQARLTSPAIATLQAHAIRYTGFLKNAGQIRDMKNLPVNSVLYYGQLNNRSIYITSKGLSFLFYKIKEKKNSTVVTKSIKNSDTLTHFELERVDISLLNAQIRPNKIETKDAAPDALYNFYFDSYSENGAAQRLKNEILIKDVYSGVDWRIFLQQQGDSVSLKYEFIVHPGARPEDIKLRYSDNAKIALTGEGLNIKTQMGFINEANPYAYTIADKGNKQKVESSFITKKMDIQFGLATYDHTKTLVIDPDVYWGTYLSSTLITQNYNEVVGTGVRVDSANNLYVQLYASDQTPFPTFNPGGGAYYQDFASAPNGSMILMKFTPAGQLLWSTYFGGAKPIRSRKITTDKWGNLFATAEFANGNCPIPLLDNGGYFDAGNAYARNFIAKFDDRGRLTWCSIFAASLTGITDMTSDYLGNVYLVGHSRSDFFPTVDPGNGAFCVTNPQYVAFTFFISQFDPSNRLVWSTRIEGNDDDNLGTRVHADKFGNVYIIGAGRSSEYPLVDAGGYFNTATNPNNVMITKFNPARTIVWSTRYPGSFAGMDITTDDAGDVYIASGRNFAKFNSGTNLVWEKSIPTTRNYTLRQIEFDPVNNQFQVLGQMNDFWWTFPTKNTDCPGSFFWDAQTSKYNSATGPVFLTFDKDGNTVYLSLADWVAEYYEASEMTVDKRGNSIYIFGDQRIGQYYPNPDLTNPGNGAYFDPKASNIAAFLLELKWQTLKVDSLVTPPTSCTPNGRIGLTVSCGTAPFTFQWNTGATTPSISGVGQGNYSVTVTDSKGLTKHLKFNVPPPPQGVVGFACTITKENCDKANGSINMILPAGGQAPYTFAIDQGSFSASPFFNGLDSGSYMVHIKDAAGCQFMGTVNVARISGPSQIDIGTITGNCNQATGQLNAVAYGGMSPYNYTLNTLSSSSGSFTNLAAADYLLTATDIGGCSISKTVTIRQATPATDAVITLSDDHCLSGLGGLQVPSVLGGSAPYTYSINNADFFATPQFSNLDAGSYTLYIKDNKNCMLTKSGITIKNTDGPSEIQYKVDDAVCGSLTGAISVSSIQGGSSPYTYSVDQVDHSGRPQIDQLQPGTHEIAVFDNFKCPYKENFTIKFAPGINVTITPADTAVCYNTSVTFKALSPPGALTSLLWNTGGQGNQTMLNATENKAITLQAIDTNGCRINSSAILRVEACSTPENCVILPGAFTPNSDGKNDRFGAMVNGCPVKSFKLALYNRNGEVVFKTNDYNAKWDGIFRNELQPSGVFVYLCKYTGENNVTYTKKGTFVLIR